MTEYVTYPPINSDSVIGRFYTRCGGTSSGIYTSLNAGVGSDDDPDLVAENRRIIAADISGRRDTPLLSCYQVHGKDVITVTGPFDDRPKADAMVTSRPGLILGILTADCAPVLFADHNARVIGAAHAGWQGAVKGIVETTVTTMEALGAKRGNIQAAVGPCIQQASYEVGADFQEKALAQAAHSEQYFASGKDSDHFQFDLFGFVHSEIERAGIAPAASKNDPQDTYQSESLFYSYRRSTHNSETDYGRQVSAIYLKP